MRVYDMDSLDWSFKKMRASSSFKTLRKGGLPRLQSPSGVPEPLPDVTALALISL
jgi:hypothetical protein